MKNEFIQNIYLFKTINLLDKSKEELECIFGSDFSMIKNYNQNNPHHSYDLLEHTIKTAEGIDCENLSELELQELIIAALFHDVGKPAVAFRKNGRTVFYNHAAKSKEIAEKELKKHDLEKCSLDRVLFYIEHHDDFISFKLQDEIRDTNNPFLKVINIQNVKNNISETRKLMKEKGEYVPTLRDYLLLMRLCKADAQAQAPIVMQNGTIIDSKEKKVSRIDSIRNLIEEIQSSNIQL